MDFNKEPEPIIFAGVRDINMFNMTMLTHTWLGVKYVVNELRPFLRYCAQFLQMILPDLPSPLPVA